MTIPLYVLTPDLVGWVKNDRDPRAIVWGHPLAHLAITWHVRRIFGTGEARKFKFGTHIKPGKSHLMNDKLSGPRSRSFNFKPPSVNLDQIWFTDRPLHVPSYG